VIAGVIATEEHLEQTFRCKLFGSMEVVESKGDPICKIAMQELKKVVR